MNEYFPSADGKAFNNRFTLDTKEQNSACWNVSNVGLCCNSGGVVMNFKRE